jgi:pyroglutamyl-peptidase
MNKTILLTSFEPWLAHHQSNSSDDLLELSMETIPNHNVNGYRLEWLRYLPVDGEIASQLVIGSIETIQPQLVVCCGMAECYQHLTIESQARGEDLCWQTTVNLDRLICGLTATQIGNDAGKFVCEALYFSVLSYLNSYRSPAHGIFVHVPILTDRNRESIISDFCRILTNLTVMYD